MPVTKKENLEALVKGKDAVKQDAVLPEPPAPSPMKPTPKVDAVPTTAVPVPVAKLEGRPDNAAPIKVEAPLNEAQIAAKEFVKDVLALAETWYDKRPALSSWKEPTDADKLAQIQALMSERGTSPVDFLAIGSIAAEVNAKIDQERAAAGQDKQRGIDRMYAHALVDALSAVKDQLKPLIGLTTTTRPTVGKGRGRPIGSTRKDRNPQYIAWAREQGMKDFILIDRSSEGMYGTMHAIAAREGGQWERLQYNPKDHTYTRTGTLVNNILWWTDPRTGERPKENARRVMCIRMVKDDGSVIQDNALAFLNHDGKAFSERGDFGALIKHLGF